MTDAGTRFFYEFGEFRLDSQQRVLTSGAEARPIALVPKAFETLLYLLERRGELLSKNSLLKAIWPNIVVEENSLNQTISAIRRSLGERPGEHRFIVTEPGRGYRFVADVRVISVAVKADRVQPAAERTPASAAEPHTSIAVLPFANLTGDPGKEYFGDGMAEELIHMLARIPGLRVPSRTSSFSYKGRSVDLRQIARDLDVSAVLEGSIRSAGDRIRVTAQLIDARNGFHLWSQQYDRAFGDLFSLQDELARAIVETLRSSLQAPVNDVKPRPPPSRNLEAYHLYLQAQAIQNLGPNDSNLPRALDLYQRAIRLDPLFAQAHNAIASVRAIAITVDVALPGSLAETENEILRGLALDPSLGSTHAALGVIYSAQGRWVDAEERFRQGFACDNNDPTTQQAYGMNLLGTVGSLARYVDASLTAQRLAPVWLASLLNLAVAYTLVNQDETARRHVELCLDLGFFPAAGPIVDVKAQLAVRGGRFDEAAELMTSALALAFPAATASESMGLVHRALAAPAHRAAAVAALEMLQSSMIGGQQTQFLKRRLLLWYVQLGELDRAFALMTELLDYFGRSGTIGTAWALLWMREMLPFRRDPRFQLLCRRMGLFEYWNAYGPPDNCQLRAGQLVCEEGVR
jgi:TolB-like protein